MKIQKVLNALAIMISALFILSCEKGIDNFIYKGKMLTIMVSGYNASDEELELKIDTFRSKIISTANSTINYYNAYTFLEDKKEIKLTITEKSSGKILTEKTLNKDSAPPNISMFYSNGIVSEYPKKPAVEEGKIQLRYLYRPKTTFYQGPVDIVFVKYYFTPKVFEEFARLKNVKPNEISDLITFPTMNLQGLTYNGQKTAVLFKAYLFKAGTNEFITNGTENNWHLSNSSVPVPSAKDASSKFYIFSDYIANNNNIMFTKNLEL